MIHYDLKYQELENSSKGGRRPENAPKGKPLKNGTSWDNHPTCFLCLIPPSEVVSPFTTEWLPQTPPRRKRPSATRRNERVTDDKEDRKLRNLGPHERNDLLKVNKNILL